MSVPADVPRPTPRTRATSPLASSWDRIRPTGGDSLVAAVPHLVGFPPRNSLVLVGLAHEANGRGVEVRCTERADLPGEDLTLGEVTAYTQTVVAPLARAGATMVVAVVQHDAIPEIGNRRPYAQLVDQLVLEIDEHDLWPGDMVYTDGTTYWSYGCHDSTCCPPEGRVVPEQTRTWVAAQFAAAGLAVAPSREHLTAEFAPDRHLASEVAALLAQTTRPDDLEQWRDEMIEAATGLDPTTPPSAQICAVVLTGLDDIRVRDTVLWDLAQPRTDRHATRTSLRAVLRSAPEGHVAPVATVLAIQHWQAGDGARANACLERALADNPDYSLTNLTECAIRNGMPPSAWAGVMSAVGRDACRHGNHGPETRRRVAGIAPTLAAPTLDDTLGIAQ